MTKEEVEILDLIGNVTNKFLSLNEEHSADRQDFIFHIHAIQNIILSREGLRKYKQIITNNNANK